MEDKKRFFFSREMTVDGIASYLESLHVRGIGASKSRKIAEHFGKKTFIRCSEHPYATAAVKGVSRLDSKNFYDKLHELFGAEIDEHKRRENERHRKLQVFFGAYGIRGYTLRKIEEHFDGEDIIRLVKDDPYRLTEVDGIGFTTADDVAKKMGIANDDPRRIKFGIIYTLEQNIRKDSHTCMPDSLLIQLAAKELKVEARDDLLHDAYADKLLIGEDKMAYLPQYFWAERAVANELRRMTGNQMKDEFRASQMVKRVTAYSRVHYDDQQAEAIKSALMNKVMILTGGPGTGKTTTLKGMLEAFDIIGAKYLLAAPTACAAKRMTKATGKLATTIHRMLDYHPDKGFRNNKECPLHCDVVIIDEMSMVDLLLMRAVVEALPADCRLVCIGDADQLQSVGPGNVLLDMINSDMIPVVELKTIHRQEDGSHIVEYAHEIINGLIPVIVNRGSKDFFFIDEPDDEKAADEIVDIVSRRLPKKYGSNFQIQVLCPKRDIKYTGVEQMNLALREVLNPPDPIVQGYEDTMFYRMGDRVMQIKNNYEKNVFNGDMGVVLNVTADEVLVGFSDNEVPISYSIYDITELTLCYAITVHKSQGSEFDCVVMPLLNSAGIMLQRNLLYTAITRAKKMCIIVGNRYPDDRTGKRPALDVAVRNWMKKTRYTRLYELLREEEN